MWKAVTSSQLGHQHQLNQGAPKFHMLYAVVAKTCTLRIRCRLRFFFMFPRPPALNRIIRSRAEINIDFDARCRDNNCDRSCNSCCDPSRYRSSNRLADFADCRRGALHEAARIANDGSNGKGHSFEERFIGIRHDARACHAISRHSSEQKR